MNLDTREIDPTAAVPAASDPRRTDTVRPTRRLQMRRRLTTRPVTRPMILALSVAVCGGTAAFAAQPVSEPH